MARCFSRASIIKLFFLFFLYIFPASAFSQSILPFPNFKEEWFRPIVTVFGGSAIGKVGKNQPISVPGDLTQYQYLGRDKTSAKPVGGIFLGTQILLNPQWSLALGVSYFQPANFSSGRRLLIQGVDNLSSDAFVYQYHIKSRQILGEIKLAREVYERFHPYVSLGLGVGLNTTSDYGTSVPFFLTFTPIYAKQRHTSFSYSGGIGLDVNVAPNWLLGAGYRFSDFGKTNFGTGTMGGVPFPATLSQSHLYAHQFTLQVTYSFF